MIGRARERFSLPRERAERDAAKQECATSMALRHEVNLRDSERETDSAKLLTRVCKQAATSKHTRARVCARACGCMRGGVSEWASVRVSVCACVCVFVHVRAGGFACVRVRASATVRVGVRP